VSVFPNVIELEPNDDPKQAPPAVAWPVAFNGVIEKPGDVDHFRFRAARGDAIDVTAYAFRIGSPLDTVVAVLNAAGEQVAANDDDETHDSRVRVTIPADGEYFVRVADKRNQGGPRFIYRVELDRPTPGLAIFLPEPLRKTQDRQVIAVPRGNRVAAHLAVRRDGCAGPVTITHGELPAGVKVSVPTVPSDEYLMPVVFEAAADAPVGGRLVPFTGVCGAKNPVGGGFTQVVRLIPGPGDLAIHSVELSKLAVVVVEESPFSITVVPPAAPLVPDGTVDITVKVTRDKNFTEPIEAFFPSLPPGVEAPTSVTIPADQSEAVVTLVVHPPAERGDWRMIVEAKPAKPARVRDPLAAAPAGTGRRTRRPADDPIPVASAVVGVKVAEPTVKGRFEPAAGEQGKSVTVVCQLESAAPVTGTLTAKLEGLPPRATAEPVEVKGDARRVEFRVAIDPTTPTGEHKTIVCELTGSAGGQKVVYRVGRGASLRVDSAGGATTDKDGKPLSPLEALRRQESNAPKKP
jgi:hypothetical protein